MPITETVRTLLIAAAGHPHRAVAFPERLPIAAQRAVAQSMLKAGLIEAIDPQGEQPAWRATDAGLSKIGPDAGRETRSLPAGRDGSAGSDLVRMQRSSMRSLVESLLSAWDADPASAGHAINAAVEALRGKLKPKQTAAAPRQPRANTKRALVLSLLSRPDGATVAQVVEVTGWARHTVHGFFAGLKKAGTTIEVLERVRQVGAREETKGSYTVYRVVA